LTEAEQLERLVEVAASSFRAGYAAAIAQLVDEIAAGRPRRRLRGALWRLLGNG
jgi:hypothetical protein